MALPPHVRGALDNNDSVKIEGLQGLATVEYRVLVATRRSGVILGHRGGVSRTRGVLRWVLLCNRTQSTRCNSLRPPALRAALAPLPAHTQFINDVRNRTLALVQMYDEVEESGERVLQVGLGGVWRAAAAAGAAANAPARLAVPTQLDAFDCTSHTHAALAPRHTGDVHGGRPGPDVCRV
jgi:hypothetical protein